MDERESEQDQNTIDISNESIPPISKKTGKPKRVLTEKQQEILKTARETWNEQRRQNKAKKMLVMAPKREKFEKDKEIVENELTKLKLDIEEKLKLDYENKLAAIKEEYESKFNDTKAKELVKEELKQKYTKKPKKIIEVYSTTDVESDASVAPVRPPIANKKTNHIKRENSGVFMSVEVDDEIKKFFF